MLAPRRLLAGVALTDRQTETDRLAQPDVSGNSFGNKGWFVTLGFRKYLRKFAYASQKVAIALDRNKLSVGPQTRNSGNS